MKTLHYFIIVILSLVTFLPLSIAFGQNVTVPNDLSNGNIFQLVAKDTALSGDMIEINGNLVTKDPIKIMLSDPNGTVQVSTTTFADRNGYFTAQLKMPNDAISGTWKIIGKSGNYQRELDVHVLMPDVANTTYCCLISNYTKHVVILSPLKQFKSGIAANDVKCAQGLQLVIKAEDNSPDCIKPQTAQKLVERGWGWVMQPIDSLKPLLPNRIAGLENDTGIVTFGNRTYYFETPHYTQDAYVNPVHISFHGVVFTLFPSGFRGGLPTLCTNNPEELQYYWADAKFVDSSHELLHILGVSPPCPTRPIPSMFSTNTDPLAGLTFYDGKLKLLVSVEGKLQQNNSVFSTPIPTNETIYHDFPQPRGYSIINSTQGIIVNNDAEASNLTGFSVKSPTYLPQGYKVQLIKASKEIPMVTIFVSKYPLTDNITSHDFLWNQQGILITYQQVAPHELEYFNQSFYGPEDKIIRINGTLAVISDISKQYHNGYAYDMWGNLLAIQNNDTNLAIRGFFNSDDLIKIATSMLEK